MSTIRSALMGAAALLMSTGVASATVFPIDEFSDDYTNPSVVTPGTIIGQWESQPDFDFLMLTDVGGPVTMTFYPLCGGFCYPDFSGGGVVEYSLTPLEYSPWDGTEFTVVNFVAGSMTPYSVVLDLPGVSTIYLAMLGTNQDQVQWNITYSNEPPAPTVPLPAALPLLGGGLALMGFVSRRKRA